MVNTINLFASDGVGATRVTINANIALLTNEINKIEDSLGINPDTGDMDSTNSSSGTIKAKAISGNLISLPSSGATAQIILYGSGVNAGSGVFNGTIQTNQLLVSGSSTFNGNINTVASTVAVIGGSANLNGDTSINGDLTIGIVGTERTLNTDTSAVGTFPTPSLGGGGYSTSVNSPYALQFNENIIYANCGGTGFYLKIVEGTGNTLSSLPQGFKLTIVNTSNDSGKIITGVTGSAPYYTGFNTNNAGYSGSGITVAGSKQYRSSIKLLWEPRIDANESTQKGSWVVLEATNMTV